MNDERFVSNMYNTADSVAGVKGSASTRIVFNGAMIVTVLDILWERESEAKRGECKMGETSLIKYLINEKCFLFCFLENGVQWKWFIRRRRKKKSKNLKSSWTHAPFFPSHCIFAMKLKIEKSKHPKGIKTLMILECLARVITLAYDALVRTRIYRCIGERKKRPTLEKW